MPPNDAHGALRLERNAVKLGDSLPHTTAFYQERAADCERLAGEAVTEELRQIYLMLAARWRALAPTNDGSPPDHGGDHQK
jgi:hypothetical protein